MSQKYKPKQPTGREYVDKTRAFCDTTHLRCDLLPARWGETLLFPLVRCADEIETNVILANKVYINPKNQKPEELKAAYNRRIEYLVKAVGLFADFDIKFERLMGRIDIGGAEKRRLRSLIYQIIEEDKKKNPNLAEIKITIRARPDEMEYCSLSGSRCVKLKLTAQNRHHWLLMEREALECIQKRITSDKKAVSGLK